MAIEGQIQALLEPLATGGCFDIQNESSTITYPYIVFQKITGVPLNSLSGYSGLEKKLYQLDLYAETYEEVKTLAVAVRAAMEGATFGSLLLSDRDWPTKVPGIRQVILEYSIWS